MKWFFSKNATQQQQDKKKEKKGKNITLQLDDKHEPFGTLNIETIKQILADEEFEQLQSLYFYMMRDLKIASVVLSRKQPLLGLDYSIETENKQFKEWLAENVDLSELINHCSTAIYYGVSLTDVGYSVIEHKLQPDFRLISPRYLYAHKDKKLQKTIEHLYVKQGDKKLFINKIDPDRYVFHKHAIDIGEITDFSVASKLVWYFSLKHIVLAHNLQYFDNVATPPLIAKTSGDEDELINTLFDLKSSSVGVFNTDDIIEYLNITSKADFLAFIEYIDRQIATFVLGNTLSTGEGKNGSKAQSQTHENRQTEVLHFDAKLIAKTITQYLNKLEDLNFSNAKGVKFAFDLKEKKDLTELSAVVKNLSDSGFELDIEDIEEKFGFKIVGKKEPVQTSQNTVPNSPGNKSDNHSQNARCSCGALHKSEKNAINSPKSAPKTLPKSEDFLDSKDANNVEVQEQLVNAVETVLKHANSFDEAKELLLDLYQDIPLQRLESQLFNAIANSQLLAAAEIENET